VFYANVLNNCTFYIKYTFHSKRVNETCGEWLYSSVTLNIVHLHNLCTNVFGKSSFPAAVGMAYISGMAQSVMETCT